MIRLFSVLSSAQVAFSKSKRTARRASYCLLAGLLVLSGCSSNSSPGGSEVQEVLADGEVTLAEYKQALENTRDCIAEKGYETSSPRNDPYAILWSFDISVSGPEDEGGLQAYDKCRPDHLDEIEKAYYKANIPTGAKRDELFTKMIACLESVEVPGVDHSFTEPQIVNAIIESLPGDPTEGLVCLAQFSDIFPEGMLGL